MGTENQDDFDTAFDAVVAEMENPAAPPATPPETPPATPPETPPATPPETPEQKAAREQVEAAIKPYEPTEEEKAALAKFKADFPGEYQAVEAQFKAHKQAFNAQVYDAVQNILKQVAPRLASVEQSAVDAENERHFTTVYAAHSDYDAVQPKLKPWIESLPPLDQPGRMAAYMHGDTKAVLALLADYKKANNMTTPTAPVAPAAPAAPVKPKPDGSDLAPVSSRRPVTTPKGEADPTDFDGAFNEEAERLDRAA